MNMAAPYAPNCGFIFKDIAQRDRESFSERHLPRCLICRRNLESSTLLEHPIGDVSALFKDFPTDPTLQCKDFASEKEERETPGPSLPVPLFQRVPRMELGAG